MLKVYKRKNTNQLKILEGAIKKVDAYKGKQELILYVVTLIGLILLISGGLKNEIAEYHPKTVPPRPAIKVSSTPTAASISARPPSLTITKMPTPLVSLRVSVFSTPTLTPTPKPVSHAVVQGESVNNLTISITPTPDQTFVIFSSPTPAGQSAQPCLVSLNDSCVLARQQLPILK